MSFVKQHPVLVFFVLAYALAWGGIPFGSFFAPGALVAALVVVSVTEGVSGLKEMGRRLVRWRVAPVWYVVAIGVPLLVHVVTVGANLGLGAGAPSTDQLTPWYGVLLVAGMNLVLGGPLSEEPSFRGFAQAKLQDRRTPLAATTIMALAVTGWHLPLLFLASFGLSPIESLATIAVTFWYAWLFDHARGSVLIVVLAHAAEGSIGVTDWWTSGAAEPRQAVLYTIVWTAVAVGLVLGDRQFWTRPARREATDAGDRQLADAVAK